MSLFSPPPPLPPMAFTRKPILPFFWGVALGGAAGGIFLGLLLWLFALLELPAWSPDQPTLKLLHARLQGGFFIGFFILGFAFQAGPHVLGAQPLPSSHLLRAGLFLFLLSLAGLFFPYAAYAAVPVWLYFAFLALRLARTALPERKGPIATPLLLGLLPFAALPIAPLEQPAWGLALLLSGGVSVVLAAGQQLIANVLGGRRVAPPFSAWFLPLFLLAWSLPFAAALAIVPWSLAGIAWLALVALFLVATRLHAVLVRAASPSLGLSLGAGLLWFAAAAFLLVLDAPLDAALHALTAGGLATLILGVGARVVSHFSARHLFREGALLLLLAAWQLTVAARVAYGLGWIDPLASRPFALIATALLCAWILPMAAGLLRLRRLVTQLPRP